MAANPCNAQLWAAVRALTDAELDRVQEVIRLYHCVNASPLHSRPIDSSSDQNVAISIQLGDTAQRVPVDNFVHVFLDYVHHQVQFHAEAQVSDCTQPRVTPTTSSTNMAAVATFNTEFPQLSSVEMKSTKRRITTTLLASNKSTVRARPVPAAIAFPPLEGSKDTKVPIGSKHSLLEKRMGATPSFLNATAAPSPWGSISLAWGAANPEIMTTNQQKHLSVKTVLNPKIATSQSPRKQPLEVQRSHLQPEFRQQEHRENLASNQEEDVAGSTTLSKMATSRAESKFKNSASAFHVNRQAAKLYGFLIREHFVKTTCVELQVLVSLLYRADCLSCNHSAVQLDSESDCRNHAGMTEFCWRTHCLGFAKIVFYEIEPILMHLSADLIKLFKICLTEATNIFQDLVKRLEQESQRREELCKAESARLGCQLPVEMKASAVRNFALPFNETTDSRLHYRSPFEAFLYTNREKARDGLLTLLRNFQQQHHSVVGFDNEAIAVAMAAARELLADVSRENRWWFAKFFVQELVQIGANPFGENDNDLVLKILKDKLVVKNPDRLRKLHRRFSSQKAATQTSQPRNGYLSNKTREKGNALNQSLRKSRQEKIHINDVGQEWMATLNRMKHYFTDNQLFFFYFLHTCDSYEFNELVKRHLEHEFDTIRCCASDRKSFTEVVLKLKVVAKFLGYFHFSPQWQMTTSGQCLSMDNEAYQAIERDGIHTLERSRGSTLDVKKLLETSILDGKIAKCIPWLGDYLCMLSLDKFSLQTTYFKQLIVLLYLLYRSRRLTELGETGLYIVMQLERIFDLLSVVGSVWRRKGFQSKVLCPSDEMYEMLQQEGITTGQLTDHDVGEDREPFLYSQVFVQSCVNELEDLRGFIQTRRNEFKGSRARVNVTHFATPLRKLRPLQIVIEPDASGASPSFTIPSDSNTFKISVSKQDQETDTMYDAVCKVHPRLKAVVDFVVTTVTTDVCAHVIQHIAMSRADSFVDHCSKESNAGHVVTSATAPVSHGDPAFATAFQRFWTLQTRDEANATVRMAFDTALRVGQERVRAAIPALMPPSAPPTLIQSIVHVALQHTRRALEMLVPKSTQTEFDKRVAFRNKRRWKDPETVITGTMSMKPTSLCTGTDVERDLRRLGALLSNTANHQQDKGDVEWQAQAQTLLKYVSEFSIKLKEYEDLARQASALVLWDIIWRGITSCLRFFEISIDNFAERYLVLMKCERVKSIKNECIKLATGFASLFEVVLRLIGTAEDDDAVVARVQSLLIFVLDSVTKLPSKKLALSGKGHLLAKQSAVRISSLVVAKLQAVVIAADEQCRVDVNWDHYLLSHHSEIA